MPSTSRRRRLAPAVLSALLALLVLVPGAPSAAAAAAAAPAEVARDYLAKNAAELGVTRADAGDLYVTSSYRSAHSGVTHVNLNQRHESLEVFGGHVTVNVAADGTVLLAAGSLVPNLAETSGEVKLAPAEAVGAAADGLDLEQPDGVEVISTAGGPAQETLLTGGGISDAPIPARLGWQATDGGLRKAWQLVIDDSSDVDLWKVIVDAETGATLEVDNWTSDVHGSDLASTLARAEPVSAPRGLMAAEGVTVSNGVADGTSYRVLALPKESPNDGERTLVTNPADATASPYGWHDTDGAAGAEFTIARGNNTHAYLDQDSNNSADFGEPDAGPGLAFDFGLDLSEHAQNYRAAAVTNLFHWNNVIHDVMYQYGFTEAAGNFQANNYGRGGTQGDYVRAEAADGAGTNNANFSTPIETATTGGTPRMQMYLWPGNQFGPQNQVVVGGVGSFGSSWARFSPAPTVTGTSGQFVDAGNGCTADLYAGAPAGDWIAVVTGGNAGCQNIVKARTAEAAGAQAVVVTHTTSAAAPILTGSLTTAGPAIPVASITQADGNALRTAIAAGPTTGTVRKHPDHPGIRDGDLENGIIIHEYGHGISNRLTGGPNVNCLSGNEQAGEGWSDYFAIVMLMNPALDNPDGPRGMGPYALFQDNRQGAGIRPRPYSRNMEIQPFTYDSIKTGGWLGGASLAAPHGIGHGWASILWDLTWDLVDKHGFNPDVYGVWSSGGNNRSLQYVVDGLKLQGCSPGFVAARNGILAATMPSAETHGEDTCTVWAAFARRGLGYSAVQGTTDRNDNEEAFDTHPECLRGFFGGIAPGPSLNNARAGSTQSMVFTLGGNQGLDILAANQPYSRQVDCTTLRTVTPGQSDITPRPLPVPTETPGSSGLSYNPDEDRYTYPWKTLQEWDGTCREFVLTRTDGLQHRAFFRFSTDPTFPVSGRVLTTAGTAVANATVRFGDSLVTTTDATGYYSFAAVTKGSYTATATGPGRCIGSQTKEVSVAGKTTVDFALPPQADSFGYSCVLQSLPFEQADTVLALTGDDVSTVIDLPFAFTLYGQTSAQARVCTNGWIELGATGPLTTFSNVAVPATARPNGVVYGFWDDLVVDADASVRTELKGTAPNRRFVVEYRNVRFFNDTTRRLDFSVVLHENGEIVTQHRSIADDGRERGNSATIGIENAAGTVALQYSFNQPVLDVAPAVTSIRYRPPAG